MVITTKVGADLAQALLPLTRGAAVGALVMVVVAGVVGVCALKSHGRKSILRPVNIETVFMGNHPPSN